jgi:hypothetical protein
MAMRTLLTMSCVLITIIALAARVRAQGVEPYPNAVTDRLIHQETPMAPPPKNVVFTDPDFGSSMVRATDATTDFKFPNTFLQSEGSGKANEWSVDTKKFYVMGKGGRDFVFGFDPATMAISSLPNGSNRHGPDHTAKTGSIVQFC